MDYIPKPFHAIAAALLCVVCILLAIKYPHYKDAWYVGALLCGGVSLVIIIMLLLSSLNERVRVMTEWGYMFSKLDDEGRAAMAFVFPFMRYRMKSGNVRAYFEDTNVPIETFRLFLQTSNEKYISPERDWNSEDMPRADWLAIKNYLEAKGNIVPDSAAGNHSWLWRGDSYHNLMVYWMAGRKIVNMNVEMEG